MPHEDCCTKLSFELGEHINIRINSVLKALFSAIGDSSNENNINRNAEMAYIVYASGPLAHRRLVAATTYSKFLIHFLSTFLCLDPLQLNS